MIGALAYTPMQIAGMEAIRVLGEPTYGDLRLVSAIREETGYSFKRILGEVENIRQIRRYKSDARAYLKSKSARRIFDSYNALPTLEKAMALFVPEKSPFYQTKGRISVVGIDLFNQLDLHFIPEWGRYREVDMFKDGDFKLPPFHMIGNDRQIADNIVDLITDPEATAIVIDVGGPVSDAVRAALYRNGIPFKNNMPVRDLMQVRDYLKFLRTALDFETVRVKNVREIFAQYGGRIPSNLDEYLLCKQTFDGREREIFEVMENIRSMSFSEVMEAIVPDFHKPQIKIILSDLGFTDEKVCSRRVEEIVYMVDNVSDLHHNEPIPESEKRGVLLTDCCNSVYIDRPMVFYVGLGPEWEKNVGNNEYIDVEAESDKGDLAFTIMLQQGESRLYAVNKMRRGGNARPCPVFDRVLKRACESFDDVCGGCIEGRWTFRKEVVPTMSGSAAIEADDKWTFSQSSYNQFRACPRAFMYHDLLHSTDSEHTVFGNLVHEFAEFYATYPGKYAEKGMTDDERMAHYPDLLLSRYTGISCEQMEPVDRTKLRVAVSNIVRYIDMNDLYAAPDVPNNGGDANWIIAHEGLVSRSSTCEKKVTDNRIMSGKMDLVYGGLIVDYKTGRVNNITKHLKMLEGKGRFDFQPIFYLALSHVCGLGCERFDFVYVSDKPIESKLGAESISIVHVHTDERSLAEILRGTAEQFCKAGNAQKFIPVWDGLCDRLIAADLENLETCRKDESFKRETLNQLGVKETKKDLQQLGTIINQINKSIGGGCFASETELIVPIETIETFVKKVAEDHAKVDGYRRTGFPAEPVNGCDKCDYKKVCTRFVNVVNDGEEDDSDV